MELGTASVVPDDRGRRRFSLATALDVATLAIVAVMAIIAVRTFEDYGITWDETWHMNYGGYILDWYASGFTDRTALVYRLDYIYGGAFDAIGAFVSRLTPLPAHDTMHMFGSVIGIFGVVGT